MSLCTFPPGRLPHGFASTPDCPLLNDVVEGGECETDAWYACEAADTVVEREKIGKLDVDGLKAFNKSSPLCPPPNSFLPVLWLVGLVEERARLGSVPNAPLDGLVPMVFPSVST